MTRTTIDGEPWSSFAACHGDRPDLWEPPVTVHHVLTCGACPVRALCAAEGVERGDRWTVRAALDCTTTDGRDALRGAASGVRPSAVLSTAAHVARVRYA